MGNKYGLPDSTLENLLGKYYGNDAKGIRKLTDRAILHCGGGVEDKDLDDYYSLAGIVFDDVLSRYDEKQPFEGLLFASLCNKIKSQFTANRRYKRTADRLCDSFSMPVGEDGESVLEDFIASDFDINKEIEDDDCKAFMENLSELQRKLVKLKMDGYSGEEMKKILNISTKKYESQWKAIRSYENTKIFSVSREQNNKGDITVVIPTEARSNKKTIDMKYSVEACMRKIKRAEILLDYPLQRKSGRWDTESKNNLIATVLREERFSPLVMCEEVVQKGISRNWLVDGKQRLTYIISYVENGFAIGKNVEFPEVYYQSAIKDEDGNLVKDEVGRPVYEDKVFNVVNKKFKDLPEELQTIILEYEVPFTEYLNCTPKDIAWHIRRYNLGTKMNAAEKSITYVNDSVARICKLLAQHKFFKDTGNYKVSEQNGSVVERIIMESVMATNYLSDWKKNAKDMAKYIEENAKKSHFDVFEEYLDRLTNTIDENAGKLFTSRDSFIWFTLFDKFTKYENMDDGRFNDFLNAFVEKLRSKKVGGVSFDDLSDKGTKDKNVIIKKLEILETLMCEYMNIDYVQENIENTFIVTDDFKAYMDEFYSNSLMTALAVQPEAEKIRVAAKAAMLVEDNQIMDFDDGDIQRWINKPFSSDIAEDVLLALDVVNDWSLEVDNNSLAFRSNNIPSVIAVAKRIIDRDEDRIGAEWFKYFVETYDDKIYSKKSVTSNYAAIDTSYTQFIEVHG